MAETWAAIGILAAGMLGTLFYLGTRIDSLASRMDARFDAIEGRFDSRFDRLEARVETLAARFESHLDEHPRRRAR